MADPKDRFIIEQSNFLKKAFVRVLRVVFADSSIPAEYRYDSDKTKRQIWIYRAFPKRITSLPALIIESETADVSIKQLGQEIVEQELSDDRKTLLANIYGGVVWMPIKITVLAKTTTDRELLLDIVSGYIRYAARPLFARNKIEYLDISAGETGDEAFGPTERMFIGTIEVKCQTEFKQRIDMTVYNSIQKIDLTLNYDVGGEEV